eukprot:13753189-Heterocapsa_arctica.AAC.1
MGADSWVIWPGTAAADPPVSSMAVPCASTSALCLSVLGASSASLFLPPIFEAATTGPNVSAAGFGFACPAANSSFLGPVTCEPELPPVGPCGVDGAERPDGSAFSARPFGASCVLGLYPCPSMISETACW